MAEQAKYNCRTKNEVYIMRRFMLQFSNILSIIPPTVAFCAFAGSCRRKRIKVVLSSSGLWDEEKTFSF